MASSKKPRGADPAAAVQVFLGDSPLQRKRVCVGLSGGVDSVALLHVLHCLKGKKKYSLRAVHVHHGLSPYADEWAGFCRRLCREWRGPPPPHPPKNKKEGRGGASQGGPARPGGFLEEPPRVFWRPPPPCHPP